MRMVLDDPLLKFMATGLQWECLLQVFHPSYQWGVEHAILTLTVVAEVECLLQVVHPLYSQWGVKHAILTLTVVAEVECHLQDLSSNILWV